MFLYHPSEINAIAWDLRSRETVSLRCAGKGVEQWRCGVDYPFSPQTSGWRDER
jgi:hypothetical protein